MLNVYHLLRHRLHLCSAPARSGCPSSDGPPPRAHWGEATRTGDTAGAEEAVKAMATARQWPILQEMNSTGDYPEVLWEDAAAMPRGYFVWNGHHRDLIAHAEGLGCARFGLPLTPEKMKIQRE